MAINRILFDLVNPRTRQLTFEKLLRHEVLNYHLVKRTGGKQFKSILNGGQMHPPNIDFDKVSPGNTLRGTHKRKFEKNI